jgi:hypothetical protein
LCGRLVKPFPVTSEDIESAIDQIVEWNYSGDADDKILPRGGDMEHCSWLYSVLASDEAWKLLVVENGRAISFVEFLNEAKYEFEQVTKFMRLWMTETTAVGITSEMVIETGFLQKTSMRQLCATNPIKFCLDYHRGTDLHVLLVMLRGYILAYGWLINDRAKAKALNYPVHASLAHHDPRVLHTLLVAGARVDTLDHRGRTPLCTVSTPTL